MNLWCSEPTKGIFLGGGLTSGETFPIHSEGKILLVHNQTFEISNNI